LFIVGKAYPEFIRSATWVSRVNDFMTNSDGAWHVQQSKIAIAQGEFFGQGPGNSMQRNHLPNPYSDFIYAIIIEEYGLFGGLIVLALYVGLFMRCVSIVTRSPKTYGAMLVLGLGSLMTVQALANMAVAVHLVPVTGLNLPVMSMGGTSMFITCIQFGMILSVSRYIEKTNTSNSALESAAG
jgi:cell division protein FtsW